MHSIFSSRFRAVVHISERIMGYPVKKLAIFGREVRSCGNAIAQLAVLTESYYFPFHDNAGAK